MKALLRGLVFGCVASLLVRFGIATLLHFRSLVFWVLVLLVFVLIALSIIQQIARGGNFVRSLAFARIDFSGQDGGPDFLETVLLFIAFAIIAWFFPTMIIIWSGVTGDGAKKAIRLAVILITTALSIVYFLRNRDKFRTVPDVVTYFAGVIGLAAIIASLI